MTEKCGSVPREKTGLAPQPALSVSLPAELYHYARHTWREHKKMDGTLANNLSQYIADLLARDRARRDKVRR